VNVVVALGGKVVPKKKVKKLASDIEIMLVDALTLPPHTTAVAPQVEAVIRHVRDTDVAILDLSWLVQSMVERKKLAYEGFEIVSDGRHQAMTAIKVAESIGTPRRYQIGDTVKLRLQGGRTSFARLLELHESTKSRTGPVKVHVRLLVS
jgi:hypothetical protein